MVVPGLLWTADYTRTLFQTSARRHTGEKTETEVRVRRIRQERLLAEDDPLGLVTIIDESVLHRPVDGREVMRAQLERLVSAAELPTVTFQVLPLASCAHLGLDGPFSVLSFGELGEPDLAYVEYLNGAVHMEEEDVTRASIVFGRLRSGALSPADSVSLVERAMADDVRARGLIMSARVPASVGWRKSSFSAGENDDSLGCVEVALLADGGVALRDSKDRDGQVHVYTAAEWDAFVKGVQAGEFNCP